MRYHLRHLILSAASLALLTGLAARNSARPQDDRASGFSDLTLEIAVANKKDFVHTTHTDPE